MFKFFKNKIFLILIAVVVAVIIVISFANREKNKANGVTNVIGTIITPVQSSATGIANAFSDFFSNFSSKKKLLLENKQLQNKVDNLSTKETETEYLKKEVENLKSLIGYKDANKQYSYVSASIIAKDNPGLFKGFTIKAGTSDGLLNKMPVVNEKGLIGFTIDVGKDFAKVVSILDSAAAVGAMVVRTSDVAVVEGDIALGDKGLCKMSYISANATLLPGDSVITSGLGGVYPKGILIGKIKEIRMDIEGVSKYAIIEPSVDFEKLSDVLVIKGF